MKKPITRSEKLLFVIPILLILGAISVQRWQKPKPITIPVKGAVQITALSYSPDGKRLAVFATGSISPGNFGKVFNVESHAGIPLVQPKPPGASTFSGANYQSPVWSPDGTRIASVYDEQVSKIAPWDAETGNLTEDYAYTPNLQPVPRDSLHYSPDGKKLIAEDSPPTIFDAATGAKLRVLKGTFPQSLYGSFNEKLGLLAIQDNRELRFQIFDTKAKRVVWGSWTGVSDFKWHGDLLAIFESDKSRVLLWNGKTRKRLPSPILRLHGPPNGIAFHPKKSLLAFTDTNYGVGSDMHMEPAKAELVVWDYEKNTEAWRIPVQPLSNLRWSPDGKSLSAIVSSPEGNTGSLQIFDADGKLQFERNIANDTYAWSPDSKHIAYPVTKSLPASVEILNVWK